MGHFSVETLDLPGSTLSGNQQRTCFHSFRHNFRDELRLAQIDHDIAMALGGWTNGVTGKGGASENYGVGHRVKSLSDAISKLNFSDVSMAHLKAEAG